MEEIINKNLKFVKIGTKKEVKWEEDIINNICQFYGIKFNRIEGNEINVQGLQEDINLFEDYIIKRYDIKKLYKTFLFNIIKK